MVIGVPQFSRPAFAGAFPLAVPAMQRALSDPGGARREVAPPVSPTAPVGPPLPVGRLAQERYDTVTVSVRHGLETVDILRLRRACGSVLQSAGGTAIAFLVPAGTVDRWHLPGSTCTAGAPALSPTDPLWVMPPAGPGAAVRPTDAWVLRSALCEAACTLTAGGLGPLL
ncbi:hypothetical protein CFP65_2511 [Kitasatospora sp. MMS16-BH015]|uniref:hypothetical protein n=1 Tax=Kitasatospora sp. MMS16-BH015 TaxID=2018025 RepID=UPI000CA230E5|nr:hypothetical protein [Kitasatospora sp. MMS16-BH015]AUG77340.1 hypothetical protein CFP65_2511 [Kitasatospora sp. MMS16-BH015]